MTHCRIQLANSLNRLDCGEKLLVQGTNLFTEPIQLPNGALMEKYHFIQKEDVGLAQETVDDAQGTPPSDQMKRCS